MGYITTKDLTGNEASTGVARQPEIEAPKKIEELEQKLKESEVKPEKKKKKVPKKKKSV